MPGLLCLRHRASEDKDFGESLKFVCISDNDGGLFQQQETFTFRTSNRLGILLQSGGISNDEVQAEE